MERSKTRTGRRNFLIAVGAGSGAAIAAVAAKSVPQTGGRRDEAKARDGAGYKLSEHVRKYYRTHTGLERRKPPCC